MNLDAFTERAAIMEYDGGLSRFDAETAAAKEQGYLRHEFINRLRASEPARDHRPANAGHAADALSRVQPWSAQEDRPLPQRDVQAGRHPVDVLALRMERG